MTAAPVIETGRLRLRPLVSEDIAAWSAVTADPAVVRYLGGTSLSGEDTARRILATAGCWTIHGFGYWAVIEHGDDRMIGHVGFADFHRDMAPPLGNGPEMGWVFAREAQGRGLAGEAVAAALDWADATLASGIAAIIDPDNAESIRVAERAGFIKESRAVYRDAPILIFRRPPPAR